MGGAGAAAVPTAATWGPVPRLQGPAAVRELLFVGGRTDPDDGGKITADVRDPTGHWGMRARGRSVAITIELCREGQRKTPNRAMEALSLESGGSPSSAAMSCYMAYK